ncbi:MAG TPA: SDR family oxidoreductase [Chloroflexota bacterium]|nr:SDR family oxidoreductase [Chloroflexota bacterium]
MAGALPLKSVVVTGASSGIGWATTRVLVDRGVHVFGSVRREQDAARLSTTFGERVTPLRFDITDEAAVRRGAGEVQERLGASTLFGLVNNAGIAVPGPLMYLPPDEFRHQLEVNLVGALVVTQAFLPSLGADRSRQGKPGRIVNVSSVAGQSGGPFLGAYAASKHGLEGLSESLRRELMLFGIDVIIVAPGMVATPIWDKGEAVDASRYDATAYAPAIRRVREFMLSQGRRGFPPERVGEVIWHALSTPRPRVRYAVVPRRLLSWTIPRLLPRRLVDRIIARRLGWG